MPGITVYHTPFTIKVKWFLLYVFFQWKERILKEEFTSVVDQIFKKSIFVFLQK